MSQSISESILSKVYATFRPGYICPEHQSVCCLSQIVLQGPNYDALFFACTLCHLSGSL